MGKDALDKVMDMDDPAPTDEDQTADKDTAPAADDPNVEPDDKPKEPTLEERLAELEEMKKDYEKKNKGLYHAKQEEKTKRQQLEQELSVIKDKYSEVAGYVKALIEKRSAPAVEEKKEPPVSPVVFDDDGNSKVDLSPAIEYFNKELSAIRKEISSLGSKSSKEVQELKQREAQMVAEREAQQENERVVNSVIAENREFKSAKSVMDEAWNWMNNKLSAIQEEKGVKEINPTIAIDLLEEEGVGTDFAKEYPGVNFERLVRAYESVPSLRRALKEFAKKDVKPKEDQDQLRKLAGKPSNLASADNRRGPSADIMDQLEGLTFDDILEADDATIKKLHNAVAKAAE